MWVCPGCFNTFTSKGGYARHLSMSQQASCKNAYAAGLSSSSVTHHRAPAPDEFGFRTEPLNTPSSPCDLPGEIPFHWQRDVAMESEPEDSDEEVIYEAFDPDDGKDRTRSPSPDPWEVMTKLLRENLNDMDYPREVGSEFEGTSSENLDEDEEELNAGLEHAWEQARPVDDEDTEPSPDLNSEDGGHGSDDDFEVLKARLLNPDELHILPTIVHYPDEHAGTSVTPPPEATPTSHNEDNPYSPFASKMDWELARWAKMRGPSSTAFSELLGIDGVSEHFVLFFDGFNVPR